MQQAELAGSNQAGPCEQGARRDVCCSCVLDSSSFFSGLGLEAKWMLQSLMRFARYERRDTLYREGDASERLFVIMSGTVKLYQSLPNARQQIHKLVQIPGDLIGCEDLYRQCHSGTAEAIGPVTACYISKSALRQAGDVFNEINYTLMEAMARDLNAYIRHIADLGQKSAVERVGSYLLYLQETHQYLQRPGGVLPESLTRVELGEMLGITQRTLSRSLRQLESDRLIATVKEGFVILDVDRIRTLVGNWETD